MAVLECRQVVAWTVPTLALLASLLWLRRRYRNRDPPTSDPGGLLQYLNSSTPAPSKVPSEEFPISPISCDTPEDLLPAGVGPEPSSESISEVLEAADSCEDSGDTGPSEEIVEEERSAVFDALPVSAGITVSDSEGDSDSGVNFASEIVPAEPVLPEIGEEVITDVSSDHEEPAIGVTAEESAPPEVDEVPVKTVEVIPEPKEGDVHNTDDENRNIEALSEEDETSALKSEVETVTVEEKESQILEHESNQSEVASEIEEDKTEMEKGVLEEKLASLVLDTMKISEDDGKQNAERDSANQSPSEVMLASPSMSNFSDAHSEGSSDSGKGHSDVATSPSRTPAGGSSLAGDSAFSVYEFVLPQVMVGRLIGRHGSFIHEIRTSTHTNIFIKRHPDTSKLKICAIEGTQQDIEKALAKIRQKFPLRRFPKLTLEKVSFISLNNPPPLKPEDFHLQLVEGVNNDVILSSLISAAHFFLQQPSHPTYSALCRLNQVMNNVYSNAEAPVLETPVKDAICAAPTMGGWYRAQIVSMDEESQKCDVRFVDYGGYLKLETSLLRQIRADLLMLPFQAVECYLANVVPAGEEEDWTEEARLVVQSLTHGQLLQAQIYDYAEDGTPQVYLYSTLGSQIILINEELVARGFATIVTPAAEE